jgi:hypothetical protein
MFAELRKRPKLISIFGVKWFVISAGQIIAISAPGIRDVAIWYPMVYGTLIALRFISVVGIWHLKKWGVELFVYSTLLKIIVQVLVGDFTGASIADAVLFILGAIVFASYYKKMERNL